MPISFNARLNDAQGAQLRMAGVIVEKVVLVQLTKKLNRNQGSIYENQYDFRKD